MLAKHSVDSAKVAPPWAANAARPFVGLRPFDYWDYAFFFGREAYVRQLYRMLDRSRFVAVVGSSGSGKSSLVSAGLRPLLEQESLEGGGREWLWTELRPGDAPLSRLARAIAHVDRPAPVGSDPEALTLAHADRLEATLRRSSLGLVQVLSQLRSHHAQTLLLLVDQFEEIFRYANLHEEGPSNSFAHTERFDEATAFVQLLLEAARDRRLSARIVLTMRSDFIGDCGRYLGLAEAVSASQFLIPQLARDELETTIRRPIAKAGASIAPELVQTLLNDASGDSDQLPVLQHTLMRIWDEAARKELLLTDSSALSKTSVGGSAGARHLTMQHYGAIGTFSHALSKHAEEIMSDLPGLEVAAEQTFRTLAELDRDTHAVRRPLPFDRLLAETGVPEPDLRLVVDRFRRQDCCFLLPTQPTPIASDTIVDVAHEALIRRWHRMSVNTITISDDRGWLWAEADDGNVYRGLLAIACDSASATLPLDQVERRWRWWTSRPRTEAWGARYGGHLDNVQRLFRNSVAALESDRERRRQEEQLREYLARKEQERQQLLNDTLRLEEKQARLLAEKSQLEQQALSAQLAEQTKLAQERRRFTQLAAGAATVAFILATVAGIGFLQARAAVIETKAASFWNRLQLWGDSLRPEDVVTLWDLTQEDENVRVAFVRQMANDPGLLRRFGFNPQPIARAIGLQWPDEAREIARQSVAYVASDRFDPETANPFELIAYTRALAALQPWLDPALADAATKKLADAINGLAGGPQLSDRRLWALAETVAVFSGRLDPAAIERARERLRQEIMATAATDDAGRRARPISLAIETLAPDLTREERLQAVLYLVRRLGQDTESWSANAIPRAMAALLPKLDAGQAAEMLRAVPPAIATAGVAAGIDDSSYLLAVMQVVETLGSIDSERVVASFAQALTDRLGLPNDPLQRTALVRAAVPLLARLGGRAAILASSVAEETLVPEQTGVGLDPAHRSLLRQDALKKAEAALQQAFPNSDGAQKERRSEAALQILHNEWSAAPPPNARANPYRGAAQARLLGMLALSLTPDSAALATADLRKMLPLTRDYLTREAIARALAALASTTLADADEREAALADAKAALAKSGSTEEATAWADAIAALLPAEPRAATAEIVEALKYPTATGAPTNILLAALAKPWPEEHKTIAGRTLPDPTVMDWLEARLPDGHSLSEPPPPPPNLRSADAGPEPG